MSRLLITTVGTSLLTNRDDRPWTWSPRNDDPLPNPDDVDSWLTNADPIKASAEMNTLHRRDIGATDRISFLHSDTLEGKYCSERLGTYYANKCREVKQCVLKSLNYGDQSFAQSGLKSLISVTLQEIRSARSLRLMPTFCATGGFKAEIAFLNLLGALLNIEVYYIHELHREEVQLPRLPLTWDADYVLQHQDFFEWLKEDLRKSPEVENRLKACPELRPLVANVEMDGESYTDLSAAGELLYEAAKEFRPRAVWPQSSPNSPEKKNGLSGVEHHRPNGWEQYVDRLCKIDCVSYVRYNNDVRSRSNVNVINGEEGTIGVCFGPTGNVLPLQVDTTAKGIEQTELVADHIRKIRQ
ncbi:putative CRISPR-associated protein [Candidatus Poribacteria bacterium]|nr:putative CRISPR-associated protein [Candidatus Poribacteria bacterium]MYB66625.1 putative CRISPR-associated protein [Candidatus Poribacteria bacterium]MYF56792.1 putative CRISPR-associated protein [Candidatus Poribacteria bacterium]MYI92896.1 putative CRISPR-associated protein [Candidatus Poribacteria bacterium]